MIAMSKRGVRPVFAILMILLAVMGLLWIILQIAGSSINQFAQQSDLYQLRLRGISRDWIAWWRTKGVIINTETFNSLINPANTMKWVVNALTQFLRGMLTNTFLILLTVVFLLFELAGLPNKLKLALGANHPSIPGLDRFSAVLNRYLAIKSVISLLTGLCAYVLCLFLGLDFAHLWGLLAFLLNYVPNIGSILAAVPPVMLALVEFGTPRAFGCTIGYLIINITFGNIIEPRVMGRGLGLSTLVVWMSLIFWGWVLGPIGMLLSVPLTMIAKIALALQQTTDNKNYQLKLRHKR
jgi:predicted PurR-regulated permease PerM